MTSLLRWNDTDPMAIYENYGPHFKSGAEYEAWHTAGIELTAAALEIAKDDPSLLDDYPGFERVMWSDDGDMKRYGMSRDQFREVLQEVYEHCRKYK